MLSGGVRSSVSGTGTNFRPIQPAASKTTMAIASRRIQRHHRVRFGAGGLMGEFVSDMAPTVAFRKAECISSFEYGQRGPTFQPRLGSKCF
jgi:hypothetical protein